ncbi:MAG: GntR family transcriptional regulator [Synergistetes bacterium]|nr:GntR family transcriptional regulator [Synergistota bacterium]MDK2871534.1 GntR family transcriptional regulator, vanillate catabolism transcriptional regulator [bacterium]
MKDIAELIKRGIIMGKFLPGQRLNEADLAVEFGVSRTPVREALRELVACGLLEYEKHKGIRVKRYTLSEIRYIYEVWSELEAIAARLSASRIDEASLRRMKDVLDKQERLVRLGEINWDYIELNDEFHLVIASSTQNPYLLKMLSNMRELMRLYRLGSPGCLGRLKDSFEEHKRIFEAIKNRDPEGAYASAFTHVRNAFAYLENRGVSEIGVRAL